MTAGRSVYFDERGRMWPDLLDGLERRLAIKNAQLRARWVNPRGDRDEPDDRRER